MRRDLFVGVVAAADERSGFDDGEVEFLKTVFFVRREGVGMDPADNGEMVFSRLEILADGEDVDFISA